MDYIGHQILLAGLEAYPKDLKSLVNVPFPQTLRSMQSLLEMLELLQSFHRKFRNLRACALQITGG